MTNSEIWLDETLSNLKGIKSDLWMLHEIMSMPNCNDCKRKDCSYKPKWGEHIRYNCPLHLAEADRKDEPTISKMEQVEDEPQMREATAEERQAVRDYIESISEKTGVMFYGKDEPQTDCDKCQHRYDGTAEYCRTCGASNFQPKDEPQTDCAWR